ncbi:hypothetical protein L1987_87856 [Smallanthus sonchifolius]|nr:hypothetical protein L1987_87856 [Smallanthus sonchifolius]
MALAVEMIVRRVFFSILVLHHVTFMIYAQDDQSGFISIDCGSLQGSNYTQLGINYISDDYGFIEAGESHKTTSVYVDSSFRVYNTLRSFPQNERNCYTLRPQEGKNNRYLIKAIFFYGNYDSRGHPPQFDLYIGADYWDTIRVDPVKLLTYEMIHLTSSDYIYVCLVNTGSGNPFITALELRLLNITMYEEQPSLYLFNRYNFGTNEVVS